jgi:magnesium transporter
MAEDRDRALSLAFMREHPAQAARVVEALPVAQAAVLFERAPARLGAAVLTAMLPGRAALCLASLDDARALELLASMATQPTVAVLRQVSEPRRRRLVAALPTAASLASTLLLGYSEDTLGAWADPDVVALPADSRAGDTLDRLRQAPAAHALVFVVNAERRLAGVVAVTALLTAPAEATLATLMSRPVALLAAFAPLSAALSHPGWESSSILPVVEPGDRLVGVITRHALARALRREAPPAAAAADITLPVLLGRSYWQALSASLALGLAWLPRVTPVAAAADDGDER